jgi:hypothetical protein
MYRDGGRGVAVGARVRSHMAGKRLLLGSRILGGGEGHQSAKASRVGYTATSAEGKF